MIFMFTNRSATEKVSYFGFTASFLDTMSPSLKNKYTTTKWLNVQPAGNGVVSDFHLRLNYLGL